MQVVIEHPHVLPCRPDAKLALALVCGELLAEPWQVGGECARVHVEALCNAGIAAPIDEISLAGCPLRR